ncbi:hypothetical protein Hdeb2414_s0962g00968771 [Helianthus debilis subsp. tardiflorus]
MAEMEWWCRRLYFFRSYVIFVPFAFSYGCQTSPASKLSFHKYHHLFMKI